MHFTIRLNAVIQGDNFTVVKLTHCKRTFFNQWGKGSILQKNYSWVGRFLCLIIDKRTKMELHYASHSGPPHTISLQNSDFLHDSGYRTCLSVVAKIFYFLSHWFLCMVLLSYYTWIFHLLENYILFLTWFSFLGWKCLDGEIGFEKICARKPPFINIGSSQQITIY